MELKDSIEIEAPADKVWEVIGPGFARVGDWATPVPHSQENVHPASDAAAGAPCAARVCETTVKGFAAIDETITAYDAARRTLSYRVAGLPTFVKEMANTWRVDEVGPGRTHVSLQARMRVAGAGILMAPMLRWTMGKTARVTLEDLKHYVERGAVSPRKKRQLDRRAERATAA